MHPIRHPAPVAALLGEPERISGRADTQRAASDQALIRNLRPEVAELRRAVAHLRAAAGPLPARLGPVVARAVPATAPDRAAAR
jgi:hypothetical protein